MSVQKALRLRECQGSSGLHGKHPVLRVQQHLLRSAPLIPHGALRTPPSTALGHSVDVTCFSWASQHLEFSLAALEAF